MNSYTQLLTVIYVFLLLWSKTCVDGSMEWCLPGAEVDLMGVSPDFSGYFNKYGLDFPPNATSIKNGETVGCLCKFRTCFQFCCPLGYATHGNRCVEDYLTPFIIAIHQNNSTELPSWRKNGPRIFRGRSQRVLIYHTPEIISVNSAKLADVTDVFEDGSVRRGSVKFDLGSYCILRQTNSSNFEIHEYARFVTLLNGGLAAVLLGTCLTCAIATFIIYTIISDLKNLRGSILRCYLASYIICFCLQILLVLITWSLYSYICMFGAVYFRFACALWSSVMSYDTWKVFGKFESTPDVHIKQEERKKFFWYSIYAWGGSFLLFVIAVCSFMFAVLYGKNTATNFDYVLRTIVVFPVAMIIICNMYFYGSTALMIRRRKKEMAHLVDGVNKHHKINQGWFNLYLRLYVIMGGAAILWIPAYYTNEAAYPVFLCTVEALQFVLMFITCVWRDEVKRSFRQLLNRIRMC